MVARPLVGRVETLTAFRLADVRIKVRSTNPARARWIHHYPLRQREKDRQAPGGFPGARGRSLPNRAKCSRGRIIAGLFGFLESVPGTALFLSAALCDCLTSST